MSVLPASFELPDLSDLAPELIRSHMLTMTFKPAEAFRGDAQFLATTYVRTTDAAVRHYEFARVRLVRARQEDRDMGFLSGCSDLEIALMSMNRTMRLAEALRRSSATTIGPAAIPSAGDQARLREMRVAIEHNVDPILDGKAGIGLALAVEVSAADMSISRKGKRVTIAQVEFGEWARALHALAAKLATNPASCKR